MSGRIPQGFIDDLLDRLDIVDVVDHRVKLKKTGKNYSACCPFHEEKTPSFTVSPDKQFYYCFGCGASGNALGFLMEYEHLDFINAVEDLAKLAGLEIPRDNKPASAAQIAREKQRHEILDLLDKANDFYQEQLRQHPRKPQAVNYLKGRGLTGQICKDFGIGFSPPGWDNLKNQLCQNDAGLKRLEEAGMLIHNEEKNRHYDRFRERIMFPIRDKRGRVIGFGGRVLGDDKPKYLNSPETPVFHKGEELYGLWEARQAHSQIPKLIVVEGYMDVVALAQYDIRYAVATLGTACGEAHLNLAFKYTQEIIFCFDGDKAGRNAAKRALQASLPVINDGRQIKFIFLEEGQDPDSYVRQLGTENFLIRIEEIASPLEVFLFDSLSEDLDPTTMGGKALLSKRSAPMLNLLPKGVYRELMFQNLARRTDLPLDTLMDLINQPLPKPEPAPQEHKDKQNQPPSNEDRVAPQNNNPEHKGFSGGHEQPPAHLEAGALDDGYDQSFIQSQEQEYQTDYSEEFHSHEQGQQDASYNSEPPTHDYQPPQANSTVGAQQLTPQRLLIGLIISDPQLAKDLDNIEIYRELDDSDSQLLLKLCQCLKARPHFNILQLSGHWLASYGAEEWTHLKQISAQTTDVLKAATSNQQFDPAAELAGCQDKILKLNLRNQSRKQLSDLRGKALSELSDEEKAIYRRLTQR